MTSTAISTPVRPVRVHEIEDTVTFHLPQDHTQNLAPYAAGLRPVRRPKLDNTAEQPRYEVPRTFGIVDEPLVTGALPPHVQYAVRSHRRKYAAQHSHARPVGLVGWLRWLIRGAR